MFVCHFTLFTVANERPALSRDAVVNAARDIVAADGLDGLSLRRVAKVLGVTAPALYAHVDDKLDLLRAVAELEFEHLAARFDDIETADPVERVGQQAFVYVEHALEDPALFQVRHIGGQHGAGTAGEHIQPRGLTRHVRQTPHDM